jgi:hypothetical protein
MDQPIEQPIAPQAGNTRPQTAQLPASSPVTLCHAGLQDFTNIPSTYIRTYIKRGMVECADLYGKLSSKWSDIYAAACEVERRFEKRPGARNDVNELRVTGWEEFLEECGIKPATFRKWRQRAAAAIKPLESFVDPPKPNGAKPAPRPKGKKSRSTASDAQALAAEAAAKDLADAEKKLGPAAAAGNAQAVAIIAEYRKAATTADRSALTNEDSSTADNSMLIDPTESESAGVQLAVEGFLVATPTIAEPEKVAAAPNMLNPPVSELSAEPDWKHVLVELIAVLEQSGQRLPLVVLKEKLKIESLLAGKWQGSPEGAAFSNTTKRYNKVERLDAEGNRRWTVVAEGVKKPWGTFETKSEADQAIANLNSPVVSLSDNADGSKKLPVSITPDCAGHGSMNGRAV